MNIFMTIILFLISLNKWITPSKIELKSNSLLANKNGLVHYWPFDSHIQDIVGGAHLSNGSNASLTYDRKGRPFSALDIRNGYYQLPSVNYFPTGNFTISLWVKPKSFNDWSRLFDFFDGNLKNTVSFLLSPGIVGSVGVQIRNVYTSVIFYIFSTKSIGLNQWTFLAFTYDSSAMRIYFNSTLVENKTNTNPLPNITRLYNFIGKRSYETQQLINVIYDDLKIFKKGLSQQEILNEMKYSSK